MSLSGQQLWVKGSASPRFSELNDLSNGFVQCKLRWAGPSRRGKSSNCSFTPIPRPEATDHP